MSHYCRLLVLCSSILLSSQQEDLIHQHWLVLTYASLMRSHCGPWYFKSQSHHLIIGVFHNKFTYWWSKKTKAAPLASPENQLAIFSKGPWTQQISTPSQSPPTSSIPAGPLNLWLKLIKLLTLLWFIISILSAKVSTCPNLNTLMVCVNVPAVYHCHSKY